MGSPLWPLQPGADWLPLPGRLADRYLVRNQRHDAPTEGAEGRVVEAQSLLENGITRAIKFPHLLARDCGREALSGYVQIAARSRSLPHQNLGQTLAILELFDVPECVALGWPPVGLVMEYYPRTLGQVLHSCRNSNHFLSADRVLAWLEGLIGGLQVLHTHCRLVHRDIKPNNIMFKLVGPNRRFTTPAGLQAHDLMMLTDFGTVCPVNTRECVRVNRDAWKDPRYFPAADEDDGEYPAFQPDADIYSLGKVIEVIAEQVDPRHAGRLRDLAGQCLHSSVRPSAADLAQHLGTLRQGPPEAASPVQLLPLPTPPSTGASAPPSGYLPNRHENFVGRRFVFAAFEDYYTRCEDLQQGGVFLVIGPAGIGKSALLTNWAGIGGPSPGFYYRYGGGLKHSSQMVLSLAEQIARRFSLPLPAAPSVLSVNYLKDILTQAGRVMKQGQRSLIFVDALDECDDARDAIELIPRSELPRGIFFVVSAREQKPGWPTTTDWLAPFVGCGRITIDPQSEGNLQDIQDYLRLQLGESLSRSERQELAENTGGLFLIASLLCRDIHNGMRTIPETLAFTRGWGKLQGGELFAQFYTESWARAVVSMQQDGEGPLKQLATVMTVARDAIGPEALGNILGWEDPDLRDRRIQAIRWFLEPRPDPDAVQEPQEDLNSNAPASIQVLTLLHQSIREFFEDTKKGLGLDQKRRSRMHRQIGKYYHQAGGSNGQRWTETGPDGRPVIDYYGRCNAVSHLLATEEPECVRHAIELLTTPSFLQATLGDERRLVQGGE